MNEQVPPPRCPIATFRATLIRQGRLARAAFRNDIRLRPELADRHRVELDRSGISLAWEAGWLDRLASLWIPKDHQLLDDSLRHTAATRRLAAFEPALNEALRAHDALLTAAADVLDAGGSVFPESSNWEQSLLRIQRLINATEPGPTQPDNADQAAPPPPRLNTTENDIVSVLRDAGHRLTTTQILVALNKKGLEPSQGVLKQTLAAMTRHGILTKSRSDHPPGYGLPEWSK